MNSKDDVGALESVACALCGSDDSPQFLRKDGFSIVRCAKCRLVYVNPRPRASAVRTLYEEPSYFRGDTWYLDYVGYESNHRALFREVVSTLDRHYPAKGRLLDVGCAAGFLLDTARADGWNAMGVDLSPSMADYAARTFGLDVRVGTLEETDFRPGWFDAITLCDSLEHVLDPLATMREAAQLLRPGGIVLIVTPNIASPLARLLGSAWPHLTPREHLYYFTPASLRRLISAAGLERIEDGTIGHYFTLEYIGRKLAPFLGSALRLPFLARAFSLNVGDLFMVARRA